MLNSYNRENLYKNSLFFLSTDKPETLASILSVTHLFNNYAMNVYLSPMWIVKFDNLKFKAVVRHYSIVQICLYYRIIYLFLVS